MNIPDFRTFQTLDKSAVLELYQPLIKESLREGNVSAWLTGWSDLRKLVDETYARLELNYELNTADEDAEKAFHAFLEHLYPALQEVDQQLKEKLLESGLVPEGMELALQKMVLEADLFREDNLPLMTKEEKLGSGYSKVLGAQTVEWEGEELTLVQVQSALQTEDRSQREELWRLVSGRQLEDRQEINDLWGKLLEVRRQLAENAGKPDYRSFRWQQQLRMDYSPDDSKTFLNSVLEAVVPAATRVYQRYQDRLGLQSLRPWDLLDNQSPFSLPAVEAFESEEKFVQGAGEIFTRVDPQLGAYFQQMREEGLLDLMNRKGKGPGAFCTSFATRGVPFVFMNAIGQSRDVQTLFHECGHAFHVFERSRLPYHHQWRAGMEFNEVASTAMELLASTFLKSEQGGFLDESAAARSRIQHLEGMLVFWPYMAVVVAFQHWVYENHDQAADPASCDRKWSELIDQYMPGIDFSGLQEVKETGWQRKLHIHRAPFYYIEYGLSALGAVQIWEKSQLDLPGAVSSYRKALALGGTADLPELYETAGAQFAFDVGNVTPAVRLLESTLAELDMKL